MLRKSVLLYSLSLLFFLPILIRTTSKNVCPTYLDYFLINFSKNCYYNPDVDFSVPELIEKYTQNLEEYHITTNDGYILTMFRIFRKDPIGVVILQPPISASSIVWLTDGKQSLAFALWNKGYDVWLSNHRGTQYSRKHVNLTDSQLQYWNFSFHEIAMYDLDAQFDLIRKETNESKIIYIGYSMSATEALIYASMKPEKSHKFIKLFILMAPTTIMNNFASPFKYLLTLMAPFENYFRLGEFIQMETVRTIAKSISITPYLMNILTSVVMGWTPNEREPTLHPFILTNHGRGISYKMIYHYGQIYFNENNFCMYDYGEEANSKLYGYDLPPNYPLGNITSPMYIIHGENDALSTPLDVEILCNELLPKGKVYGKWLIPDCNHVDFLFSKYKKKKIHEKIISILSKT